MDKIRILHIVPNMQSGGLESFIMNIYRNIDREKIQFDFLVHYKKRKFYDDEIEKLGGKIYRFSVREDNNFVKYIFQLNKFFKEHKEYKIIHCHMSSVGALMFLIARKNGIKVRIAHSHNTDTEKSLKGVVKALLMKPYKYFSTINFACSELAGKYLYGKKDFKVIPNAIELDKFKYNEKIRDRKRKELKCENKIVIGHVGRFELQKNHEFLINAFNEAYKENKKLELILIGNGNLYKKIKEKVNSLECKEAIKFLGVRNDTNELYQAMDLFVLPSKFEGFPLTAVEAQANGLPCLFSDTITKTVKLNENVKFIGISNTTKWANEMKNTKLTRKTKISKKVEKYDINFVTKELSKLYKKEIKNY